MKPPQYALLFLITFSLLHIFYPVWKIISFPYTLMGILITVLGFIFMMKAHSLFRKAGTGVSHAHSTTTVVTTGPYTLTRNPMYIGMIAILFGFATFAGSLISFFAPLTLFFILNTFYVPREEQKMEKQFGKRYLNYKKKVRRWL
ncbi:isoprenylcysteine carboxylmethyltransferase family protein [Candidatus Woesearchaeota archaeon]|nr:isoprenylcysteine carboxylmethyltransferase family protein [Candidatus Woesearchaeota archaeon]